MCVCWPSGDPTSGLSKASVWAEMKPARGAQLFPMKGIYVGGNVHKHAWSQVTPQHSICCRAAALVASVTVPLCPLLANCPHEPCSLRSEAQTQPCTHHSPSCAPRSSFGTEEHVTKGMFITCSAQTRTEGPDHIRRETSQPKTSLQEGRVCSANCTAPL